MNSTKQSYYQLYYVLVPALDSTSAYVLPPLLFYCTDIGGAGYLIFRLTQRGKDLAHSKNIIFLSLPDHIHSIPTAVRTRHSSSPRRVTLSYLQ